MSITVTESRNVCSSCFCEWTPNCLDYDADVDDGTVSTHVVNWR